MAVFKIILGRKSYNILNHHCSSKLTQVAMSLLHDGLPLSGYQFSTTSNAGSEAGSNVGTSDGHGELNVTLNQLKLQLAKEMGVNHPFRRVLQNREELTKYLPKTQEELPKRSMQDSFLAAIIPLSKDAALQEKYTTFLGSVRLGRLIEDMDIFTVIVARKHILNPKLPKDERFPQTIVTVLVDQIDFTNYAPKANQDIKISGHVSWVSRSTLEVVVWLEQLEDNIWQRITRALFLVATRDPTNTYASFVNAINPANEREQLILSGGEARKKRRLDVHSTHVSKTMPTIEEQKMIHNIYTRTTDPSDISMTGRILPPGCAWMGDSKISNVILAQPEDRNLHNKVFGGFIMRQATELSWVLGYMFSKYKPRTKSLSDVTFKQPIAVHSLIQMHATVVYTYKNYMQNLVFAQVYNPVTGKTATTNAFHFTLEAPDIVPEVLPLTYQEAMLYVDGYRHFHKNLRDTKGALNSKL